MQRGRLVNLVNGDTVQWQNEAGQAQQYGIRDVSRIFLNAQASRQLFPQLRRIRDVGARADPARDRCADAARGGSGERQPRLDSDRTARIEGPAGRVLGGRRSALQSGPRARLES